jgi:hypothetical protein
VDNNTLYVAGANLLLVGTTFSVQDVFLYNNGDTGAGSYIF